MYDRNWVLSNTHKDGTPLPLVPAFGRLTGAGPNSPVNLYTTFRHNVGEKIFVTRAGLMYTSIPSFCGGAMLWAFNCSANQVDLRWADGEYVMQAMQLANIEDFLGPNWVDMATQKYDEALPDRVMLHASSQEELVHVSAAAKIAAASVFAYLILRTGQYNRNILTFWDRRTGSTRAMLNWAFPFFRDGVQATGLYGLHTIREQERWGHNHGSGPIPRLFTDDMGLDADNAPGYLPVIHTLAIHEGNYRRNHNSGGDVSVGCIHTERNTPRNTHGVTRVCFIPTQDWIQPFAGPAIARVGGVPSEWYPM